MYKSLTALLALVGWGRSHRVIPKAGTCE